MKVNPTAGKNIIIKNQPQQKTTEGKTVSYERTNTSTNPFSVLGTGYCPVFKGKKENIKEEMKFADAVVNNLKNKFPTISPSKVLMTFNKEKMTNKQKEWLDEKQETLQELRYKYPSATREPQKFAETLLNNINTKGKKYTNCYEQAKLAEIALRANGVKNISTVNLVGYTNPKFKSTHSMDHTFLVVNGDFGYEKDSVEWDKPSEKYGKNAYIVDPWLGIVDTVENALEIYKKTWENIPHYRGVIGYGIEASGSLELSNHEINNLVKKHPALKLKENEELTRYEK